MEKSLSIIVSKVNYWIESVIFGELGKLVGGMLQLGISFMVNDTLPVALHIEWQYIFLFPSRCA